ncbi:MAG: EamA family transporter [Clostridia bacterium]|nr:EamA family transporter [Clostridia bacterium]
MYYGLITVSVIMFGIQFLFNERYQKESGSGIGSTFMLTFFSNLAGFIVLLIINKFQIGFTPFTFCIALLASICGILYDFCSLKAFEKINLSLYSIFAMLGGMLLPFIVGILFYDEGLSVGKIACIIFITAALFLTLDGKAQKGGTLYYMGVFVLNGMSGVLSKIFQAAPFEKTNAESYSIWSALISMATSFVFLVLWRKRIKKPSVRSYIYMIGSGAISKVANLFLLFALAALPASMQYPFVTGGVMIVSTVIAFFGRNKPSKRELLSIALAFLGTLALLVIPI